MTYAWLDAEDRIHCSRCDHITPLSGRRQGWNVKLVGGVMTEWYCPDCTTQEEYVTVVVNETLTDSEVLPDGRVIFYPRPIE